MTYKAIAGSDIKPGMTIIAKPGGPLVPVVKIDQSYGDGSFIYLYSTPQGKPVIVWLNRWYVQVVES